MTGQMTRHETRNTGRSHLRTILAAALHSVDPMAAVHANMALAGNVLRVGSRSYDLQKIRRVFVVGAGKAGVPMASAVASILGERITGGIVNVKYGHTSAAGGWQMRFGSPTVGSRRPDELPVMASRPGTGRIAIVEAGHPLPDAAGQAGAQRLADLLTGLDGRDLIIVLLSGGGSALLPLPAEGITLADYQALTNVLLRCGADITEINILRKHCSQLQGGGLARLAAPAQMVTLILSDVVGNPLDAIASGPTVPDHSSFADAIALLRHYCILDQVPPGVLAHLERGTAGLIPDTPKPGDPLFERVCSVIIGDTARAARAAVAAASRLGYRSAVLSTFIQGEAREVGKVIAGLAQGVACDQSDFAPPACLVLGGETTVTVRGAGSGGRNQELVLAAAIALDTYPLPSSVEVAIVSLATDGTDGPTDAAGGIATTDTITRGRALGLDARAALASNDSYHYLAALGDLVITGPTGTNVNDLALILVLENQPY
jgi:glycerate 2-kinase